jgi:hypothetical protein
MSNHLTDGVREGDTALADEAERVVRTYAVVLQEKAEPIVTDSSLPFPKPVIKDALKSETLRAKHKNFSVMAGTCYRQLAGFRSDAEVALWRDTSADSESKKTVERAWKEELDALDQEWQHYLTEQGLT